MPNIFRGRARGQAEAIPLGDAPVALDGATLCRCGEKCVLFAPPRSAVLINGRPAPAGIRALAHGDQIHAGADIWWFSAEDPRVVAPFPGGAGDVCPRCRQRVAAGSPAVRCGCGNSFHQTAELPCFGYAAECPVCLRPTALGGAPALPPEE